MLLSVFTPVNHAQHLQSLYHALVRQSYSQWEWVVLLSGSVRRDELDSELLNDPRVKVKTSILTSGSCNQLKKEACNYCSGDYLLEVEEDDLITPDALQTIDDVIQTEAPDFIYSDFAEFTEDGQYIAYPERLGWESYTITPDWNDRQAITVNAAFELTPSSLSQVYYAPRHLRVWSRLFYEGLEGHNTALPLANDYDLVCRTYLATSKIKHIQQCLYLYRVPASAANAMRDSDELFSVQQKIANRYIYAILETWCVRNNLLMLDLGGAHNSPGGPYKRVDMSGEVEYQADMRQGIPQIADSAVGCIRAVDFIEHIAGCLDSACTHEAPFCSVGLMNEFYRLLAPGAWLITATPSTDGRGAWQDPTHISFWNPNSFWYYTSAEHAGYIRNDKCRYQMNRCWQDYPSDFHRQHHILYVNADLVALKGQRQPGAVFI